MRELTGDIYFGQPRGIRTNEAGEREASTPCCGQRVGSASHCPRGIGIAMKRNKKLCSVDKANVLECTEFWKEIMIDVAKEYRR